MDKNLFYLTQVAHIFLQNITCLFFRTTFSFLLPLVLRIWEEDGWWNCSLCDPPFEKSWLRPCSRAIRSIFFEEQWTQNQPKYLLGLSCALNFLEIAIKYIFYVFLDIHCAVLYFRWDKFNKVFYSTLPFPRILLSISFF